eukprot:7961779-Alexandrium_andersonii.AAC.1
MRLGAQKSSSRDRRAPGTRSGCWHFSDCPKPHLAHVDSSEQSPAVACSNASPLRALGGPVLP